MPDSHPRRRLDHTPRDPLADPEVHALFAELAALTRGIDVMLISEPEAAALLAAAERHDPARDFDAYPDHPANDPINW